MRVEQLGRLGRCCVQLGLAALMSSCSAGRGYGDPQRPPAQVAGEWTGTWRSSSGVGGGVGVRFDQSGNQASGEITFTGSPCFAGGEIGGTVEGSLFDGSLRAGSVRVDLSSNVTTNQMNGTYRTVSGGMCTGDTGTFSVARTGAAQTTREPDPSLVERWRGFMAANPELAEWELCALKVATFGDVETSEALSIRAKQLCIPSDRWKLVGYASDGSPFYVDPGTVTVRAGGQVDLWTYSPVTADDESSLELISATTRWLYDCDRRTMSIVSVTTQNAAGRVATETPGPNVTSAPPGSVGERILDMSCAYRESVLSGAARERPAPKVRTVERVRPPTQDEIQQALKVYLKNRYGF